MSGVAMYSAVQTGGIDQHVMQYAPLVRRIAQHLLNRLTDAVQLDDLVQAGMLGLLDAIKNYDIGQGASFETYAGIRIRGAMLDEVRRSDWTPRSVHKKWRLVTDAIRMIENKTGQEARAEDIAEFLGISLEEYHRILEDSSSCRIFSIEELSESGDHYLDEAANFAEAPFEDVSREGLQKALAEAISGLPERERLVLSLYYGEELNLREIGEVLNVSESRVSQISSQAVLRLRSRMKGWLEQSR
ncbi:RNA polymerase sigma factor FliA [Candidatus Methylomicrobium oryzae]|jgi:RNA polymerase sigma factor for flagellar operon FliA|uniref:RNA polymerase sigma factor FliA n=1 Tax=Candidatus Methylomicrobium oryzae TaxID=2802053 RepID=UPI001923DDE1|nr:RNA polymerase sigma factor FliA [Methylomicrobium sp. RS1]MBL1265107.1 RNA polymerase sigma factor FliA [Methylomicrobium sp. RS1]